jgi:hypothetical protein
MKVIIFLKLCETLELFLFFFIPHEPWFELFSFACSTRNSR